MISAIRHIKTLFQLDSGIFMLIFVNGEARPHVNDLASLVEQLGLTQASIATAVNGCFVPAAQRKHAVLAEGDRIEIVAPMQGG